jgi:uncharacterized damage-inducible protein DinB
MTQSSSAVRDHLSRALEWDEAHADLDKAIAGIPAARRAERPAGFEHSAWDLLEHVRLAQKDLVDFCVDAQYEHALTWPDDYWPHDRTPSDAAWNSSVAAIKADRARLQKLVHDPSIDLLALVPTGKGHQTYLRAIMLVIDHNAYHIGQIVAVRRMLGIWNPA